MTKDYKIYLFNAALTDEDRKILEEEILKYINDGYRIVTILPIGHIGHTYKHQLEYHLVKD